MALDAPSPRDQVFEIDGIRIAIPRLDLARIGEVRIEVIGDLLIARALAG